MSERAEGVAHSEYDVPFAAGGTAPMGTRRTADARVAADVTHAVDAGGIPDAGSAHDRSKPLYMISVAAELTGMHPQTLRVYEQKGLVTPGRSRGNTRLYSQGDIDRLNLINKLTDEGINLAGVVRILDMRERQAEREREIDELRRRVRELEEQVHEFQMQQRIVALAKYDGSGPEQVLRGFLEAREPTLSRRS